MTREQVRARSAEDALAQADRLVGSLRAQLAQAEDSFAKANEAAELLITRLVDPLRARVAELEARRVEVCGTCGGRARSFTLVPCAACDGTGAVLVSP